MTAGTGLTVEDGAGLGVEGSNMCGPGGLCVNTQEGRTGTGIWGLGAGGYGPKRGAGAGEGSRSNTGSRALSFVGAVGVGRKGEERDQIPR